MNSSEAERLLQECIDGTAGPHERARLESWLTQNPLGRARRAQIEALFAELASVRPAAVPADLRQSVLAEIRVRALRPPSLAGSARGASESGSAAGRYAPLLRRPLALAGFAFSAGLVAGALIFGFSSRWPALSGGDTRISGAMGSAPPSRLEAVAVRLADAHVMARAWDDGTSCQIQLELLLPAGVTAELTDPTGERDPGAVRRVAGAAGPVRFEHGRVAWSETSSGSYRVELRSAPQVTAPLRLTLISTGGRSQADLPVSVSTRR